MLQLPAASLTRNTTWVPTGCGPRVMLAASAGLSADVIETGVALPYPGSLSARTSGVQPGKFGSQISCAPWSKNHSAWTMLEFTPPETGSCAVKLIVQPAAHAMVVGGAGGTGRAGASKTGDVRS